MTAPSLAALRDLVVARGQDLTFAELSQPLLEDLAVGWDDGRPISRHAAEMLSRIDGIPAIRRDQQLAGRAALTLARRRGAPLHLAVEAHEARLLGQPAFDTGDPEAEAAFERRRDQYDALERMDPGLTDVEFARQAAEALDAGRTRADEARAIGLPPDPIAAAHALALLGLSLPPGLRLWFHEEYEEPEADVRAWKFFLTGRALAQHRERMAEVGVEPGAGAGVPRRLLDAVLALDLGRLAATAVVDPA